MNAGDDMSQDAEQIYYKISELSDMLGVETSVLRFWEKEFPQIHPLKVGPRKRLYRRKDLETFQEIKRLLYDERFTIAGAKKRLLRHDSRQGDLFLEDDDKIGGTPLLDLAVTPSDELRVARVVIDEVRQGLIEIKDLLLKGRETGATAPKTPAKSVKKARSSAAKTTRTRKKAVPKEEITPPDREAPREPVTNNIFNEPLILTPELSAKSAKPLTSPADSRQTGKKFTNESD